MKIDEKKDEGCEGETLIFFIFFRNHSRLGMVEGFQQVPKFLKALAFTEGNNPGYGLR